MKKECYPICNFNLYPLSDYYESNLKERNSDLYKNSKFWGKFEGYNLLYSDGSLSQEKVNPYLDFKVGFFSISSTLKDRIFYFSENNDLNSYYKIRLNGNSLKLILLPNQDFPILNIEGLYKILYKKPFFSKEGSKKELEARINFLSNIFNDIYRYRFDEDISKMESLFSESFKNLNQGKLVTILNKAEKFYEINSEEISRYLFKIERERIISNLILI